MILGNPLYKYSALLKFEKKLHFKSVTETAYSNISILVTIFTI